MLSNFYDSLVVSNSVIFSLDQNWKTYVGLGANFTNIFGTKAEPAFAQMISDPFIGNNI